MNIAGSAVLMFASGVIAVSQQTAIPVEQEPLHHIVLKNDQVEVIHLVLPPGETTLFHSHSRDRIAVDLSTTTLVFQKLSGPESDPQSTKPGELSVLTAGKEPFIHRVRNVGPQSYEVLDVEFLQRPEDPSGTAIAPVAAENPSARIYRWTLAPGAVSAMHSHERPYLIVATAAFKLKMSAPDGRSLSEEVKPGDFHWIDAKTTHSLANEGSLPGEILEIELK